MEKLLTRVRLFIERRNAEKLSAIPLEDEENTYQLFFAESGEKAGEVVLDINGKLLMFAEFDEEDSVSEERKSKEEIQRITETFIREIFPDAVHQLHLSTIVDFDEFYVLDYVQKDRKLGLSLPNSGVSFYIYKNGFIMDITNDMNDYEAIYPGAILSDNEACKYFIGNLSPELMIKKYDKDLYIDGSDELKLVYDFVNTADLDVKMDGTLTTMDDMGMESYEYKSLPRLLGKECSVYSMAGALTMEKVLEDDSAEGRIEVWSHLSKEQLNKEYESEDLIDMDIAIENVIKMMIDPNNGKLKKMITVKEENDGARLNEDQAYESALRILFNQFPTADQLFKLRIESSALIDYDDEGEELPPYGFQFNFERFEKGIQVEDCNVSITICAFSGDLCEWNTSEHVNDNFTMLTKIEPVPLEKALELYEKSFFMKLQWARAENEDGEPYYELVYIPAFNHSGGTIHCIDAETIEPWVVDITGMEEY